jgi:hypothetical protein
VPNVLSLHGGDLYDPSKPLSPHRHRPLRMWVRHLLHAADHLVGQSADTNAHRYYDPELPVSRISLSIRRPEVIRANRADYGFGAHDRLLVTIGRLVTRKAVDQLIALLDRLPATTGFWSSAPAPRRRSSAVRRPRPGSRTGSTSSASSRSAGSSRSSRSLGPVRLDQPARGLRPRVPGSDGVWPAGGLLRPGRTDRFPREWGGR